MKNEAVDEFQHASSMPRAAGMTKSHCREAPHPAMML